MARKLTEQELQLLDKLYNDKELQFRGFIRKFKIANTYEPKYKIGDFVKVTDDTFTYICGERIRDLNAKVTDINWWLNDKGEEFVQYELEILDQKGRDHFACAEESINGQWQKRRITGTSDTNVNHFKKLDTPDSTSLSLEDCR